MKWTKEEDRNKALKVHDSREMHSGVKSTLFGPFQKITKDTETLSEEDHCLEEPAYSLQALYFLSINYILGVGCLGIPYAFAKAGFILCSSILLIVTIFSYMTIMWLAETGVRYEKQSAEEFVESENSRLLLIETAPDGENRYEVIDLVHFYLGNFQKIVYQVSLMALMYIGLLAFSQVFCGAIFTILWSSSEDAWTGLPQLIFGIMVVPLSCMELHEQVHVQGFMAAVRFVAIFIIAFGSITALLLDDSNSHRQHAPFLATPEPEECKMSYTSCFSGFGIAFSTSLFSQLFQHSIPGLLRPLKEQREKLPKIPRTLGAALLTTSSLYLLLGTTAASYFGGKTRSSINLNFSNFYFGLDPTSSPYYLTVMLKVASTIVVMFPALDTISVFPLIAFTLGNNLYSAAGARSTRWVARCLMLYRSKFHSRSTAVSLDDADDDDDDDSIASNEKTEELKEADKVASILWRLAAALPPLLGSLVAPDLSFSLLLAGAAGIYVAFFAPALLHLASSRQSIGPTVFSGWYSNRVLCFPVIVFASFSLGVVLLQIREAVFERY